MFSEGDRYSWLNAVAARIMDGGLNPPSLSLLHLTVPPMVLTRESDGHCTAAAAFGEPRRKDMEAGWRVIIGEMVTVLREQGFVGGSDEGLTWIKPVDGTWRVPMPDGSQPKVFGQRERRMDRDRSFVGERSDAPDAGVERVGIPSQFESGRMHPLELQVIGPRGGTTTQRFELHPLALSIPPMTEAEREMLRASIERDGVKVPIEIYQKKILDGRNRAYFASQLHKPVRITLFEGTEEEARQHVLILNIHRRHLNGVQLAIMAEEFFGARASRQAKESQVDAAIRGNQNRSPVPVISQEPANPYAGLERNEIVAKMAREAGISTTITGNSIRAIQPVMRAPLTLARAKAGDFAKMPDAHKAALLENGMPVPLSLPEIKPKSVNDRLGMVLDNLKHILRNYEINPGKAMPHEISGRIREARDLLTKVENALRERKVIT